MQNVTPSSQFEITRRDPAGNASAQYPSDTVKAQAAFLALVVGATYAPRGFALGAAPVLNADGTDAFQPAQATNFVGHLTRDVVVGGLTLADRMFGRTSPSPVGLVGPFTAGQEVSVEKAQEIECEGASFLLQSGTGVITPTTAIGTKLTFLQGLLATQNSAEGDHPFYTLTANGLPDTNGGNTRIRCERL